MLKFFQNQDLGEKLLGTFPRWIAEASGDTLYGIKWKPDDPRAQDPALWEGKNLMGQVLKEVRSALHKAKTQPEIGDEWGQEI